MLHSPSPDRTEWPTQELSRSGACRRSRSGSDCCDPPGPVLYIRLQRKSARRFHEPNVPGQYSRVPQPQSTRAPLKGTGFLRIPFPLLERS
jgi:hypothetical protein